MDRFDQTPEASASAPRALKAGLWLGLGLLVAGAIYLYAVRGNALILDLSSGLAGMLCL